MCDRLEEMFTGPHKVRNYLKAVSSDSTDQLAFESSDLHLISIANGKMIPQLNLGNTEVPFSSCDLGPSLRCLLFEIKQLILRCLLFEIKQLILRCLLVEIGQLILPFSSWALGPSLRCLLFEIKQLILRCLLVEIILIKATYFTYFTFLLLSSGSSITMPVSRINNLLLPPGLDFPDSLHPCFHGAVNV